MKLYADMMNKHPFLPAPAAVARLVRTALPVRTQLLYRMANDNHEKAMGSIDNILGKADARDGQDRQFFERTSAGENRL